MVTIPKHMKSKQLTTIEKQLPKYLTLQVTDPNSLKEASTYLVSAKKELKAVKADMDTLLDPLKESINLIKEKYDPRLKALKSVVDYLSDQTSQYATQIENQRIAQEQAISERVKDGKGNLSVESAVKRIEALPTVTPLDSMSFRNVPQLVIENLDLIPREYLIPDESKIKTALKAGLTVNGAKLVNKQVAWNGK